MRKVTSAELAKGYKDEYRDGLRWISDAIIAGKEIVAPEIQDPPKVVDLMEAPRRSLDSASTTKKELAKVALVGSRRSRAKGRKSQAFRKVTAG